MWCPYEGKYKSLARRYAGAMRTKAVHGWPCFRRYPNLIITRPLNIVRSMLRSGFHLSFMLASGTMLVGPGCKKEAPITQNHYHTHYDTTIVFQNVDIDSLVATTVDSLNGAGALVNTVEVYAGEETGAWLAMIGAALLMHSYIGLVIMGPGMLQVYMRRIAVEERALEAGFGEAYVNMKARTQRLVPCIW